MEDNPRVTIENVEDFRGEGNMEFSHQSLVMKSMNKVIELGSKELKEGYIDQTQTNNKGNIKPIYTEDTRRTFIEAVKTCEMVMVCDYDEEAFEKINAIHKKQEDKRKELLLIQWNFYNQHNFQYKRDNPTAEHYFNINFPYYNFFLEFQIDFHREIFAELTMLTKRIGFYEEGEYHA
ncbi:MAG TPA: hypothetical protein VJ438_03030 [Candidatus Nanoarchaeia archaeon]|nr:hypothetical protein [Candidatus Nanoarchaeia archaeon]